MTDSTPHSVQALRDRIEIAFDSGATQEEWKDAMAALDSLFEQLSSAQTEIINLKLANDGWYQDSVREAQENERLREQLETLQEKARRFLVATSGPPEKIEDAGKARRELVDALHASYPASEPKEEA